MAQRTNMTPNSTNSVGFNKSVFIVIVMIVALFAFVLWIAGIASGAYEVKWLAAASVMYLANFAFLAAMREKPAESRDWTSRKFQFRDWLLLIYGLILGLGNNWACAFLWFQRKYSFFSTLVIATTGSLMALYVALALLVAWLTEGNWRKAFLLAAAVSILLASVALRLRLF